MTTAVRNTAHSVEAMSDYVGRHRLFRKVKIEGGGLEPVVLHGNPNYVPRHYLSHGNPNYVPRHYLSHDKLAKLRAAFSDYDNVFLL